MLSMSSPTASKARICGNPPPTNNTPITRKLLVKAFRKHLTFRGLRKLCNGPETPTEWKSESVSTDGFTKIGDIDAYLPLWKRAHMDGTL